VRISERPARTGSPAAVSVTALEAVSKLELPLDPGPKEAVSELERFFDPRLKRLSQN